MKRLHVIRQSIALLLAVPVFVTWSLRSEAERNRITDADHVVVMVANYIGDASFALTGALTAGTEGMDLLGCIVVGFVTALGGGTLRDIALGRLPLFWAVAWDEASLCVLVSGAVFFLWPKQSQSLGLSTNDKWIFWTDTLGLGIFAALGAQTAALHEPRVNNFACAVAGMFTATFGGLARDVLCQKPPRILYSAREIYAVAALGGALACLAVLRIGGSTLLMEATMLGTWVTIELRVLAINHGLRLPTFPKDCVYEGAQLKMAASKRSRSIGPRHNSMSTLTSELLARSNLSHYFRNFSNESLAGHIGPSPELVDSPQSAQA